MIPKYVLKNLPIGSGSIIGRDNIEEFFNHVSMVEDFEDRSLVELAPNYEIATASLVHMLEARFVNLSPIMQHMFLKLHDTEDGEKKDFIFDLPTANGCNKSLQLLVDRAKIKKTISWHCARHSYGTNLIHNGTDIYIASQLLGHQSLAHTKRYVRASREMNQKKLCWITMRIISPSNSPL
jgi:integrase